MINHIKQFFYSRSIKQKMMFITMSVSVAGIVAVGSSILFKGLENLNKIQTINLQVMADIVGDNASGYLMFNDNPGATRSLESLRAKKQITKAVLFEKNRSMFALYARDEERRIYEFHRLKGAKVSGLNAWKEVWVADELAGFLYLESDNSLINEFIEKAIIELLVIIVFGILVSYLIASKLQKIVSDPIEHLTETASRITANKDFNLRAEKESDDEVGVLTTEFNKMLSQIQARNQALLESENKFREVVEQSVDLLFLIGSRGELKDVNNAACKSLGYERGELVGKTAADIDRNVAEFDKIITRMDHLGEGAILDIDSEYVKKNGDVFPVEIRLGYVDIRGGRLILSSARDITERKQAQDKLQKANDMLEEKVNERTRELIATNIELSKSKEKAEEANRAKSLFLANMSHEIRTPMNAVLGFTEVLEKSGLNEQQTGFLKSIQAGGKSLLSLINDILDLSKIEAGKMKMEFEKVYIRQVLEEVKQVLFMSAKNKGISLSLVVDESVPEAIMTDELRLRQILLNLINNAIKYTREGSVEVSAEYNIFTENEVFSSLKISVKDTGIGIPENDQKNIFKIFEQQDNQSTREYGGAGLGLAISTRLAERLNAQITVESKKGKGSCFELLIRTPEVFDTKADINKISDVSIFTFRPATILIVDDVDANRELIAEYLAGFPFNIVHAKDGEEAVNKVRNTKNLDLVLMDVRMPKMGGVEATQIIKGDMSFNKIPVVAVTASVIEDKRGDKKRSLFDAVLSKPLNRKNLIKCLAEILDAELYIEEKDEVEASFDEFKKDIVSVGEMFFEEVMEYIPILERAKNRGSFGGLDELLDVLCEISTEHKMSGFSLMIQKLRLANQQYDIEETQKLLTKVLMGINNLRGITHE